MPHPHGNCKRLFGADGNNAIWDPHGLSAVELEDLVAVMAIVRGQAGGPVPGPAGGREQLSSARRSAYNTVTPAVRPGKDLTVPTLKATPRHCPELTF